MDRTPVRALALAAGSVAALCVPATAALAAPPDDAPGHRPEAAQAASAPHDRPQQAPDRSAEQPAGPPAEPGAAHAAGASRPEQSGAQQAPADPPGNNGTIKVDAEAFDTHPGNEPHVDCSFQVDFYGFDEGDLSAHVLFDAHAPTGDRRLLEDHVFIGEDANDGGGSEAGLDAQRTYDLTSALAGIEPHSQQGWHVKLTIHAEGSQGADTKHKVFWVSGCEAPADTDTETDTDADTETDTDADVTPTTPQEGAVAPSVVIPAPVAPEAPAPMGVLGLQVQRAPAAAAPAPAPAGAEVAGVQLARTGIDAGVLAALGLGLALAGWALVRRPTHR